MHHPPQDDLFRIMFNNHSTVMLIVDPDSGAILRANLAAGNYYGYPREQLESMKIQQINQLPPDQIKRRMSQVARKEENRFIFAHRLASGEVRQVEVFSSIMPVDGKDLLFSIIHDITALQQARADRIHQNKLYAALSQTNQSIARLKNREELFQEVCRISVRYGGFKLAWIGLIDPDRAQVRPVAHAGEASAYLNELDLPLDPTAPEASGPIDMVCHQGQHYICNALLSTPVTADWQKRALCCGIQSIVCLPLWMNEKVVGTFALYATEADFFSEPLIELLDRMAVDISHALENLEREKQRDRAEMELRNSEERFRGIFDHAPIGIYQSTVEGRFLSANGRVAQMFGYATPHELIDEVSNISEQLYLDPMQRQEVLGAALACGGFLNRDIQYRRKDGSVFIGNVSMRAVRTDSGAVRYVEGFLEDITDRMREQNELLKLSQAVEQSPLSIVITDCAGNIEFVNPKFEQRTGFLKEDVLGKNPCVQKSGKTPPEVYRDLWSTVSSGKVWEGEIYNKKKHDELFWEHVTVSPLRNHQGTITHYIAMKEDITDKKSIEEQLFHAQKMEAIGTLAGGVAHDFNNILTVIMAYASLIKMAPAETPPYSVQKMAQEITASVERATALTQSLLTFSRKRPLDLRSTDLNEIIHGIGGSLLRLIGEDIAFELQLHEGNLCAMVDKGQIEQVMVNLVVNARDAMPAGGKISISTADATLTGEHALPGLAPGNYGVITVADNGCGIEKEIQERIFDPFFTTKEVGKGTGLGLSMAYGIVKTHKGNIKVCSEVESGTNFTIYLPLISPQQLESPEQSEEAVPRGSETILLVEDDSFIREVTQEVLERFGYQVFAAQNGEQALALVAGLTQPVDLAILDVIMPGLTGPQTYDEILRKHPGLPAIFMSGYPADVITKRGIRQEELSYLPKPVHPATLLSKIREVLEQTVKGDQGAGI